MVAEQRLSISDTTSLPSLSGFPGLYALGVAKFICIFGQVIFPPCPTGNHNIFCILWDTDKQTPPSIVVEVEGV